MKSNTVIIVLVVAALVGFLLCKKKGDTTMSMALKDKKWPWFTCAQAEECHTNCYNQFCPYGLGEPSCEPFNFAGCAIACEAGGPKNCKL